MIGLKLGNSVQDRLNSRLITFSINVTKDHNITACPVSKQNYTKRPPGEWSIK